MTMTVYDFTTNDPTQTVGGIANSVCQKGSRRLAARLFLSVGRTANRAGSRPRSRR